MTNANSIYRLRGNCLLRFAVRLLSSRSPKRVPNLLEENWLTDCVFTIADFFSPDECQQYIQISEDVGYEEALLTGPQGQVLRKDVRNNERVMFRNDGIAEFLWQRAADFVPSEFEERTAIGVNEMLRFYRYDPGQQFNWHQDCPFERDNGEKSFLTFMIYLNDDFDGGETSFDDSCSEESFEPFSVSPQAGMALFFEHPTYHIGELVTEGRKYVLRTDVMYSSLDAEEDAPEFDDV